jgi:hypothetical protein
MRCSRRPWSAGIVLGVTLVAAAWLVLATTPVVLAASPAPSGGAGGDPRSSGQGPGLVGDPLLAIVVVAGIGVVTLGVTLAYVRATGGPGRRRS